MIELWEYNVNVIHYWNDHKDTLQWIFIIELTCYLLFYVLFINLPQDCVGKVLQLEWIEKGFDRIMHSEKFYCRNELRRIVKIEINALFICLPQECVGKVLL